MRRTTARARALARTMMAVVGALAVGALAGCARPAPQAYQWPIESGAPTPTWDAEQEQVRAIEAVQRYLDVTSKIGQNLDTANWNRVFEVADSVVADDAWYNWSYWLSNDLHLVGTPVITVDSVVLGYSDSQSREYQVRVCSDRTEVHLVDSAGDRIVDMASDRFPHMYTVLVSATGPDLVVAEAEMEGTC